MTVLYAEEEVVAKVRNLTHARLIEFCEARVVVPVEGGEGYSFRAMDVARLELACDLHEQYEMEVEAISMVMSLVDQLHGVRAEMRALVDALGDQPDTVRREVAEAICRIRYPG
ncbi:MAG: chaperone modulator CbpM [Ruegeria sp.]